MLSEIVSTQQKFMTVKQQLFIEMLQQTKNENKTMISGPGQKRLKILCRVAISGLTCFAFAM